jgi:hypothetical protein
MSTNVMATKTVTVKRWSHSCPSCSQTFDIEDRAARLAPDALYVLADDRVGIAVPDSSGRVVCPHCGHKGQVKLVGKGESNKVDLSIVVAPSWLSGSSNHDKDGMPFGGTAQDPSDTTANWIADRLKGLELIEVRGTLPDGISDPSTQQNMKIGKTGGTVPKKSAFQCAACGVSQDVLQSISASGKAGAMAAYAYQGTSPKYGRFTAPFSDFTARAYLKAFREWEFRRSDDLKGYAPNTALPVGFKTTYQRIPEHGYPRFEDMFNPRQLLVLSLLSKAILTTGQHNPDVREFAFGAFQNYIRYNNMFCFWHVGKDHIVPHLSNNNYHPKGTVVENGVFASVGMGTWVSCAEGLIETVEWQRDPWEIVSATDLQARAPALAKSIKSKGVKVYPEDRLLDASLMCQSSTNLDSVDSASLDLVITDPPFGNNIQYAELADFFYPWIKNAFKERYKDKFSLPLSPKTLEAVNNPVRNPDDPDGFFQRTLGACWKQCHRVLKPVHVSSQRG